MLRLAAMGVLILSGLLLILIVFRKKLGWALPVCLELILFLLHWVFI